MDLQPLPLPTGIRSHQIKTDSGLTHHILEAGNSRNPLIILMHGFPEIAFSWRYVMPSLAEMVLSIVGGTGDAPKLYRNGVISVGE